MSGRTRVWVEDGSVHVGTFDGVYPGRRFERDQHDGLGPGVRITGWTPVLTRLFVRYFRRRYVKQHRRLHRHEREYKDLER